MIKELKSKNTWHFRFRFYRKIISLNILLFIITILLLSTILYSIFSYSATKEIGNNTTVVLNQTSNGAKLVYNQIFNICNQLLSNHDINVLLYSNEKDILQTYNVSLVLRQIQNVYPFIESIGLYNLKNNIAYDSNSFYEDEVLLDNNKAQYSAVFPNIKTKFDSTYHLITYVLYPNFKLKSTSDVAIIFNINEDYLLNTLKSINQTTAANTFIIDSNGTVISHPDTSMFMQNLSNLDYIQKILNSNQNQGNFPFQIDGQKQLITYIKGNDLNWHFISVKPYKQIFKNLYQLREMVLVIVFLLTILGLIFSLWVSKILYRPMNTLMAKVTSMNSTKNEAIYDEYSFLSQEFSKYHDISMNRTVNQYKSMLFYKERYILNLLKGNISSLPPSLDYLDEIKKQLKGPFYCALLIKIDCFLQFKHHITSKDQSLIRFSICNIANELLGMHYINDAVVVEEDEIVVLLQLPNAQISDNVIFSISKLQATLKEYFQLTVSVSIGELVSSQTDLYKSYNNALELIKYRLFYGHESILTLDMLEKVNKVDIYPIDLEKKVINAIEQSNYTLINSYIDEFVTCISSSAYYDAINNAYQLILSLFKHFNKLLDMQRNTLYRDYSNMMEDFLSAEILDDLKLRMIAFSNQISTFLEEKNEKINTLKYAKVIDSAKLIAQENYQDSCLSIDHVASELNLSSGYLGKLFKSMTNSSFSDYLKKIRLEKAKELLVQEEEPLYVICDKVGLVNKTYFSTQFKKTYGISPSQYRNIMKNDGSSLNI